VSRLLSVILRGRGGRQYVIGNDGERVYGTWLLEGGGTDEPTIVEHRRG
jgi:hypothetical protein